MIKSEIIISLPSDFCRSTVYTLVDPHTPGHLLRVHRSLVMKDDEDLLFTAFESWRNHNHSTRGEVFLPPNCASAEPLDTREIDLLAVAYNTLPFVAVMVESLGYKLTLESNPFESTYDSTQMHLLGKLRRAYRRCFEIRCELLGDLAWPDLAGRLVRQIPL